MSSAKQAMFDEMGTEDKERALRLVLGVVQPVDWLARFKGSNETFIRGLVPLIEDILAEDRANIAEGLRLRGLI